MMPLVAPDTLDLMRVLVLVGTWSLIPLHLWTFYRVMRQLQVWRANEDERVARWRQDMATAAQLLDECRNLRAQAEISLAMARLSQARKDTADG